MSDLISRLSKLRCQYNCFDENERDAYHTLSEAIKALSDVPDTNVGDTISRQSAVSICDNAIDLWNGQLGAGALVAVRDAIKALPSADAVEVVRCKDCFFGYLYVDVQNGVTDSWIECRNPEGLNRDVSVDGYCSASIRKM